MMLIEFLRSPRRFWQGIQEYRTDWDYEGRYVGYGPFWADGLNIDGTRVDGRPNGYRKPLWKAFR